ncbi:MAG: LacI family DNA-binding transcriptional regulator [Verrucomicrobiales bacterium]|nr:LacI family DNA-binding transcriptional regulator [Verrucomicrobiales bacterium]
MKVCSRDVARAAGVSPATVSLVMNGRTHIALSESTRARVRDAAERLGYRPNQVARNLLTGRTRTLGLLLPSLASSFVARIADGVQREAGDRDQHVLLAHTRRDPAFEQRQIEMLLQHQVEGLVIVASEETLPSLESRLDVLEQAGVPCVVIDDHTHVDRVDCVVSDDRQGAEAAVAHLIHAGHRRIAHWGAGDATSSARDRLGGYRTALRRARIPFSASLVLGDSFRSAPAPEVVRQWLARRNPPTALFAANDRHLAECLPVFRDLRIRIPEDLALVGYANYDFAAYLDLTSVDQDPTALGKAATRRLLDRIASPRMKPSRMDLPTRLVVRGSSTVVPIPVPAPCPAP